MSFFRKEINEEKELILTNNFLIPKESSLYKSNLWEKMPQKIRNILYISNVEPNEIQQGYGINITINIETGEIDSEDKLPDDPSTIYTKLPVYEPQKNDIDKLRYWPSYANIVPEQRWVYLDWLSDISKSIDTGFVFILFYGLERHLLLGDFKEAFDIIIELRKYHNNNSFQSYSLAALLYSCVLRNESSFMYKLKNQLDSKTWGNEELLIKYWLKEKISTEEFPFLVMNYKDLNKRYLKGHEIERKTYIKELEEIFYKRFNTNTLPLLQIIDFSKIKKKKDIAFSNYSFPENVRFINIPKINEDRTLKKIITEIHKECHEITKNKLKEIRKKNAI